MIEAVDFHQVLKKHVDHIGHKSRLLAKVGVLEYSENLCRQILEVVVVIEQLLSFELANLVCFCLCWIGEEVRLDAATHVVFEVLDVLR